MIGDEVANDIHGAGGVVTVANVKAGIKAGIDDGSIPVTNRTLTMTYSQWEAKRGLERIVDGQRVWESFPMAGTHVYLPKGTLATDLRDRKNKRDKQGVRHSLNALRNSTIQQAIDVGVSEIEVEKIESEFERVDEEIKSLGV